jgi:hypothetical protein
MGDAERALALVRKLIVMKGIGSPIRFHYWQQGDTHAQVRAKYEANIALALHTLGLISRAGLLPGISGADGLPGLPGAANSKGLQGVIGRRGPQGPVGLPGRVLHS